MEETNSKGKEADRIESKDEDAASSDNDDVVDNDEDQYKKPGTTVRKIRTYTFRHPIKLLIQ